MSFSNRGGVVATVAVTPAKAGARSNLDPGLRRDDNDYACTVVESTRTPAPIVLDTDSLRR
jgi:hypothetical protein